MIITPLVPRQYANQPRPPPVRNGSNAKFLPRHTTSLTIGQLMTQINLLNRDRIITYHALRILW
ncbi:hypothetical protein Gotur_001767 [Gossypium turneri]